MIGRREGFDEELLRRLRRSGELLDGRLRRAVLSYGEAAVRPLCKLLCDAGWSAVHAVRLIREIDARCVIRPLLEALDRTASDQPLQRELVEALASVGEGGVDPVLRAFDAADDEEDRASFAWVLTACGVVDDRIYRRLLSLLDDIPDLGAGLLADYGDARAVGPLRRALERYPMQGGPWDDQAVIELVCAIEELGGEVPAGGRRKLRCVSQQRAHARATLLDDLGGLSHGGFVPPLDRNESCWCGSGWKYKRCHLGK